MHSSLRRGREHVPGHAGRAAGPLLDLGFHRRALGQPASETYVREIQAAIKRIAADPRRGRSRNEIRQEYLSYSIGSHTIFYLRRTDGVDVIRVLHQRMGHSRYL